MPEHNTLTGSSLHEPKGVATAAAGDVYIADGLGSGAWTAPGGATYCTTYFTDSVGVTTLPAGAPGLYTNLVGTQLFGHNDGGFLLTAASDGVIVPVSGDYTVSCWMSVRTNGTDKYDMRTDFGTQVAAVGAITATGEGGIQRYVDKLKTGAMGTAAVVTLSAGDAIYPQVRLDLSDTGAAAPGLYVNQYNMQVILLHAA